MTKDSHFYLNYFYLLEFFGLKIMTLRFDFKRNEHNHLIQLEERKNYNGRETTADGESLYLIRERRELLCCKS